MNNDIFIGLLVIIIIQFSTTALLVHLIGTKL